jgi:hypothetical protein
MQLSRVNCASHLVAALAAAGCAVAQTTWIVDSLNGPGANFTDLQSAVNAAANGDRILVRGNGIVSGSGIASYLCPTIDAKGLDIIGTGSLPAFLAGLLIIRNLAPNQRVVLSSLALGYSPSFSGGLTSFAIQASNNRGTIILDQDSMMLVNAPFNWQNFTDCDLVMITRCTTLNMGQVGIVRSRAAILGCQIHKLLDTFIPFPHTLRVESSTVWIADSLIEGDSGNANYPNTYGAAIYADPSQFYLGHGTTLLGGTNFFGGPRLYAVTSSVTSPPFGNPILHWDQTDTSVVLDGPIQWTVASEPVSALKFAENAGTLTFDQHSIPLSLTLLCAAPIQTAPWTTIAGPAYFDPGNVLLSSLAVASNTGSTSRAYTIPPGLPPITLCFQGFELTPTGGLATTNPAVWGMW